MPCVKSSSKKPSYLAVYITAIQITTKNASSDLGTFPDFSPKTRTAKRISKYVRTLTDTRSRESLFSFSHKNVPDMRQSVLGPAAPVPVCRLGRWPSGSSSSVSTTGEARWAVSSGVWRDVYIGSEIFHSVFSLDVRLFPGR